MVHFFWNNLLCVFQICMFVVLDEVVDHTHVFTKVLKTEHIPARKFPLDCEKDYEQIVLIPKALEDISVNFLIRFCAPFKTNSIFFNRTTLFCQRLFELILRGHYTPNLISIFCVLSKNYHHFFLKNNVCILKQVVQGISKLHWNFISPSGFKLSLTNNSRTDWPT